MLNGKFARACVLLVVSENGIDKDGLFEEMAFFGIDDENSKKSMEMVIENMVDEKMLVLKGGVYDVTEKGVKQLAALVEEQREMLGRIETLVTRYDRAFLA